MAAMQLWDTDLNRTCQGVLHGPRAWVQRHDPRVHGWVEGHHVVGPIHRHLHEDNAALPHRQRPASVQEICLQDFRRGLRAEERKCC